MKKLCLFIALGLIIAPAQAATDSLKPMVYNVKPAKYKNYGSVNSATPRDFEFYLQSPSMPYRRLNMNANPSLASAAMGSFTFLDPYVIRINDVDYVLVKDNKDNKWSVENILGYDDSKDDLFGALKKLESDGNPNKITAKELKKASIRFVKLNTDGSLALDERELDYNINNVQYIDMKNLRTALGNKNQDGTFGYFYVIVKDGAKNKAMPGRVTFEEKKDLQRYVE